MQMYIQTTDWHTFIEWSLAFGSLQYKSICYNLDVRDQNMTKLGGNVMFKWKNPLVILSSLLEPTASRVLFLFSFLFVCFKTVPTSCDLCSEFIFPFLVHWSFPSLVSFWVNSSEMDYSFQRVAQIWWALWEFCGRYPPPDIYIVFYRL